MTINDLGVGKGNREKKFGDPSVLQEKIVRRASSRKKNWKGLLQEKKLGEPSPGKKNFRKAVHAHRKKIGEEKMNPFLNFPLPRYH